MNRYTITLNDGKRLENITMNGTMYVSKTAVTREMLNATALQKVTIAESGVKDAITIENAVCDNILHWDEGWLFNLREPTAQERAAKALQSRLEELDAALIELANLIEEG